MYGRPFISMRSGALLLSVAAALAADASGCYPGQAECEDVTSLMQASLFVGRSRGDREAPALNLQQQTRRGVQVQIPLSDFFKGGDGAGGDGMGGPDALAGPDAMADTGGFDQMGGDGDGSALPPGASYGDGGGNPDMMAAMGMMGGGDDAAMPAAMGMPQAAIPSPPPTQPVVAVTTAGPLEMASGSQKYDDATKDEVNTLDAMALDAFDADNSSLSDDENDAAAETAEDFADLQAESLDSQALEIENLKEAAEDMEVGCVNGGPPCADASSEPDNPFDARSSEDADGVGNSGSLDIPSVLHRVETRANLIMDMLVTQRGSQLSAIESAKDSYRTARKANEKEFFTQMAALDRGSATQKRLARAKRDGAKAHIVDKYSNDWQKRQARGAIRNNMTVDRRTIRTTRLAGKKALRSDRRKKRREVEMALKDALATYNLFNKKLRKARFKRNILPKIRKMITADIQGNLTLVDLAGGVEEHVAAQNVVADRSFLALKDVEAVRFHLHSMVRAQVVAPLSAHFAKLRHGLWENLGKLRNAARSQLLTSVGSVPFVSETLAAGIPSTVDGVYDSIKQAVNSSLTRVEDTIATKLTEAISSPIMDLIMPKLRSNASIAAITMPEANDLADMAKQSKLLETRSILSNWGNGLEQSRAEAATQLESILQDAKDEAKEVASELKAENTLRIEVLEPA